MPLPAVGKKGARYLAGILEGKDADPDSTDPFPCADRSARSVQEVAQLGAAVRGDQELQDQVVAAINRGDEQQCRQLLQPLLDAAQKEDAQLWAAVRSPASTDVDPARAVVSYTEDCPHSLRLALLMHVVWNYASSAQWNLNAEACVHRSMFHVALEEPLSIPTDGVRERARANPFQRDQDKATVPSMTQLKSLLVLLLQCGTNPFSCDCTLSWIGWRRDSSISTRRPVRTGAIECAKQVLARSPTLLTTVLPFRSRVRELVKNVKEGRYFGAAHLVLEYPSLVDALVLPGDAPGCVRAPMPLISLCVESGKTSVLQLLLEAKASIPHDIFTSVLRSSGALASMSRSTSILLAAGMPLRASMGTEAVLTRANRELCALLVEKGCHPFHRSRRADGAVGSMFSTVPLVLAIKRSAQTGLKQAIFDGWRRRMTSLLHNALSRWYLHPVAATVCDYAFDIDKLTPQQLRTDKRCICTCGCAVEPSDALDARVLSPLT